METAITTSGRCSIQALLVWSDGLGVSPASSPMLCKGTSLVFLALAGMSQCDAELFRTASPAGVWPSKSFLEG